MKAKLTTLFLCIFILWSSLLGSARYSSSSNFHEFKAGSEMLFKALAPGERYEVELTYFSNILLVNFAITQAYVPKESGITQSFTHQFGKNSLPFCVLRN